MKTVLLSITLIFTFLCAFSHNDLRIGDPRNSWMTYRGTIEESVLTVTPKGLFLEYGLYLTFSSRGTPLINQKDTVEITLDFDLPETAMITDSWLWFGNDTIKAEILDRWTASSIYESIVRRRRDPSVLYKLTQTQYQLRVFPMAGNQTRKVKITWMVPVNWNKNTIATDLPLLILKTSATLPSTLKIYAYENSHGKNPVISGASNINFENNSDSVFVNSKVAQIQSSDFNKWLKIEYDNPLTDGFYFSKYSTGDEGYYQLAIAPSSFIKSTKPRKVAVLADFDQSNTGLTSETVLSILKDGMLKNLSETDSFNLIVSNLEITRYKNEWVQATSSNIDSAFNKLDNKLSAYSNLGSLLANGIRFTNENKSGGEIILLSNASQYTDYQKANKLIDDLLALMKTKTKIHIADYQTMLQWYYYTDGIAYYGNGYFYSNLAKLTQGSYQNISNGNSESTVVNLAFKYAQGAINSFDLHTKLANGFCYGRHTISKNENVAYLTEVIMQVGKYKGTFPFGIEFSGEFNNEIFSKTIEISDNEQTENDVVVKNIWAGAYIRAMENSYTSNDIVGEIISQSIENRILSRYTSFLCLEDTSNWCLTCIPKVGNEINDGELTSANPLKMDKDSLLVYPNPFNDKITIEIQISENSFVEDLTLYDMKGSVVYKFDRNQFVAGATKTIRWNGLSQNGTPVNPGMYLLVCRTATMNKTIKLIKR